MSPIVRKLLREAGQSAGDIRGTGPGGRITREAARSMASRGEGHIGEAASGEAAVRRRRPARQPRGAAPTSALAAPAPADRRRPEPSPLQIDFDGEQKVTQDLTRVHKATAKAMLGAQRPPRS